MQNELYRAKNSLVGGDLNIMWLIMNDKSAHQITSCVTLLYLYFLNLGTTNESVNHQLQEVQYTWSYYHEAREIL